MVVQLRDNQRIRETFGKYIDPRVVEGLIENQNERQPHAPMQRRS
jgi:hypothetical protein